MECSLFRSNLGVWQPQHSETIFSLGLGFRFSLAFFGSFNAADWKNSEEIFKSKASGDHNIFGAQNVIHFHYEEVSEMLVSAVMLSMKFEAFSSSIMNFALSNKNSLRRRFA